MRKKICSLLLILILLLNSPILTIISAATENTNNTDEKINMELNKKQLTNKTQNEMTITGILKRESEEDPLYENPVITFKMPQEVEKVVINDINILYDDELKLGEYGVEKDKDENIVIKVPLIGKQTKHQTDEMTKGTNIIISANVILKQEIKNTTSKIIMTCVDGVDSTKKYTIEQEIKIINPSQITAPSISTDNIEGTKVNVNGIDINTKVILGSKELKNEETVYSNEIIKYEISVTNTTDAEISDIKILGNIPEGMTYVEYDKEAFSFWNERYTGLETLVPDSNGVYWQDDTYQYIVDEELKQKEIVVGKLQKDETKTYSYEVKVNTTKDMNIDTNIEVTLGDKTIYTYKISNKAQVGEFEVRMRQYQSRTAKNEFDYNVVIKNLTNEDKNATATLNIPNLAEIKNVSEIFGDEVTYEAKDGKLTINLGKIPANGFSAVTFSIKVNTTDENETETYKCVMGIDVQSTNSSKIYSSNQCIANGWIEAVKVTQSSKTNGEKVKEFGQITYIYEIENTGYVIDEWGGYTSITFEDYIPKELSVKSIEYNNFEVKKENKNSQLVYTVTNTDNKMSSIELAQVNGRDNEKTPRLKLDLNIKNGEKITIKIVADVKAFDSKENNIEISNSAMVSGEGIKTKQSNIIQNTLVHPKTTNIIEIDSNGNIIDGGDTPTPTPTPGNNSQNTKTKYSISGMVWIDENLNGQRDSGEKSKEGVEVLLYDITNQKFVTDEKGNVLTKKTDSEGKYTFTNIYTGQYYVIFEYDTNTYNVTDYQKSDVEASSNNDAVEKYVKIFNETRTVGMTDKIDLTYYKNNIDLGLVEKKSFDLKVEQFVQKVIVTNSKGTKEYTYNNKKLAKVSIHSKQFIGSTVVIEYKIKVTNFGDLTGKVYEIIDEIPSNIEFHSELNNGWTKALGYTISNVSYANTDIKPGESIEAVITLSKTLDDNDAGTYTSTVKLGTNESIRHTEDINNENNTDKASVIIEVATGIGTTFKILGGVILVLLYASLMVYFIKKVVNRKGMFVIFMFIFAMSVFSFTSKEYAYTIEGTMADLQAQVGEMVQNAVATTTSGYENSVNIALVGYNGTTGSGKFVIMTKDGKITSVGRCGSPGKHFHTVKTGENCETKIDPETGKEVIDKSNCEPIYGEEEGSWQDMSVPCVYEGPQDVRITRTSFTVDGVDPNGGKLEWSNDGLDFSLSGDLPGDFTAKETESLWEAIGSVIDPNNLGTYDMDKIQNQITGKAGINGSATSEMLQGSSGVTSLSITVTREITITITIEYEWTDKYTVDPEWRCPGCGLKEVGKNQPVYVTNKGSISKEYKQKFSTTITFEPKELPKSLTIYKFDEETGEMLYDPSNPSSSEFKFLVTNDAGGRWEVGVGESITGLHAGTYHIWEVNSPYGYGVWDDNYDTSKGYKKLQDIVINESDVIVVIKLYNKKQFIDMSGYVWEDMLNGKDNSGRNDLYDEPDKRVPGVKVILHDTVRNRELVTWTNENGEYHFGSRNKDLTYTDDTLRIVDLDKYYIEFEYNGVKYRNVKLNTDINIANASRASEERASGKSNENSEERQRFNEKFSTITSNTQIDKNNNTSTGKALDSENKEIGKLNYKSLKSHQSSIIYGDKSIYDGTSGEGKFSDAESESYGYDIYHIKATTLDNCNFSDYLEEYIKKEDTTITHISEIKNINLGLYSREQVDVAIDSDVEKFMLNIDGYEHTYTYNGVKEESFNEQMDVKLKELQNKYYERQLHESSIAYSATEAGKNLYAEITYKVYLQNKSNLQAQIKKLKLDYDSSLILKSYNYYNETDQKRSEIIGVNEEIPTIQDGKLRETIIDLEQIKVTEGFNPIISANGKNVLEITFRINANTISKIVNNPEGIKFDFMAEVESYSTYAKNEENAYRREDGTYAYASIDKNSAAGNTPVEIDNNKFITDKFENDTTIAPTFKLSKGSQTVISGIVYEDSPENGSGVRERVGDGKYDSQNENVMGNVLVELIKVSKDAADSVRDSSQKQKQVYNQDDNNIAHLYKTPTNNDDPVDTGVIARTYTKNDGTYEFSGVIPGKYVIRFVYGKNMQEIDSNGKYTGGNTNTTTIHYKSGKQPKEIEAREYKSTIITGNYISKALNITNGKEELNGDYSWFLNDKDENGRRYSDAVDDVEYRAQLEKDATVDNKLVTGNREYVYTEMQAHTAYFKLGVEANDNHNEINSATLITDGNGKLDYTYSIKNIDLGIIERPVVDLQVDKQITGLKVSLGNGQVLINGDPSRDKLPYVRTGLGDFVPIEMDTEILHGATLEEEYTITIKNNSELDYAIYPILSGETFDSDIIARRRDYYYYGKTNRLSDTEKQKAVTTRISVLGDYLGNELTADENTMAGENWEAKTIEDIANLLSEDSKKAIKDGKYTIYTTGTFANPDTNIVTIGSSKPIKYKVSKLLSTTADTMRYTNDVEILQYLGYSQNKNTTLDKNTTPGNLIPGKPQEDDEDFVRTTITPPTGTIISRWLYVTTAVAGLILVGATIIFIKKRILVK